MTDTLTATALAYYARHGAALFPIPAGKKAPTGIIASFKHDHSRDPAQWAAWQAANPGCNFGVVAFASQWIIVDPDADKVGRDAAWKAWCDLCAEWGIPVAMPHVQSARGGWHIYFQVPPHIDASQLRQPDALKGVINIRCVGYTVAAGSLFVDNGTARPYLLMSDAPPHPAPQALLDHCTRASVERTPGASRIGTYAIGDVAKLYQWMVDNGAFESYEDWLFAGMIAKVEYGEAGIPLWELTHNETVTDDVATSKWDSFADEAKSDSQTLGSLMKRAHAMGWKGQLQRSAAAMFQDVAVSGTVAAIAAAAGATLHSAQPMPLLETQKLVAALGQPILDNFLAGTRDAPARPLNNDHPNLPDNLAEHPLFDLLREAIDRIMAMAETGKKFRQDRVFNALKILHAVHSTTCESVVQRITALGGVITPGKLDSAIKNFEWEVRSEQNTQAGFITDSKGNPAPENSDNVKAFIRQRAIALRYNVWKEQVEVADGNTFTQLTDHLFGDLLMDAKNSAFNYHPAKELFRIGMVSIARRNLYDPLVERLEMLAAAWDGVPRLDTWVSRTCGTPADEYHATVGRNLIGGLVRRARHPGCEQAETVIFISPTQGTGKSTLCKILALESEWYTDSFKFGGSQQNSVPQLFGKWVVELSELAGMGQKDVEDVKQFLSSTSDNFTAKYAAFAADHPRRCVFIGTSNSRRPLQDVSGNRRFLPVNVIGEVDTDWLRANVEQIMGECAHREAAGETFGIPRAVWDIAGHHQEAARSMAPVEELCQEWFAREGGFYITATDIGRALKMAGQSQYARYSSFLDKMGWRNENLTIPGVGRKCRVWIHHTNNALEQCVRLMPVQTQVNGPVEMRQSMMTLPPAAGISPPPC